LRDILGVFTVTEHSVAQPEDSSLITFDEHVQTELIAGQTASCQNRVIVNHEDRYVPKKYTSLRNARFQVSGISSTSPELSVLVLRNEGSVERLQEMPGLHF